MALSAEDYGQQLTALLPPGPAWEESVDAFPAALLDAFAAALARLHARADDLLSETDPRLTRELLPRWESALGLPEGCTTEQGTVAARVAEVVSKVVSLGGQSRAYFIAVATALGYRITIEEFRPFRAGLSAAGGSLTNGDWVFTWRARAPAQTTSPFLAGQGAAGEALLSWGNEILECKFRQLKPAHTNVLFAYGEG